MTASKKPNILNPATGAPLLIFDSGIGGLSIVKEVQKVLPQAPVVYAADYAALPYGGKSETEIAARVPALLGRLVERYNPRLVTIACNTACTIALSHVRAALDVPVVGTVPAIKPASLATKTGVIGLLGTQATIRQSYVDRLEKEFASEMTLLRHAAPELVLAAEAHLRGENVEAKIFLNAIDGLRQQKEGQRLDIVILGCTHFPLVQDSLAGVASDLTFVDGAAGIARRIAYLCERQSWPIKPQGSQPENLFVTTDDEKHIHAYQPQLKEFGFDEISKL